MIANATSHADTRLPAPGSLTLTAGARRLGLLGALSALAACPPLPPAKTAELRFIDNGRNVVEVVGAVGARTVNAGSLGPVPALPLLGSPSLNSVDLVGQNESLAPVDNQGLRGVQTEAHLFVVDLTDLNDSLGQVGAAQPIAAWDGRTVLGATGRDVVIPFPPNAAWNTANRYRVGFLLPVVFWPNTPPLDPADFPAPPGDGSIKSVRFYRPGLCGTEIGFTSSASPGVNDARIFDSISDQLFQTFAGNSSLDGGSAVRAWSRVTTLLGDGVDVFGPNGGFFLYFWFTARAGHGLQTVNFTANYEYDFTLEDGRLAVLPVRNDLLVQPQSSFKDFADALEQRLPQTLNQTFVQSQKRSFGTCGGANGDDPAGAIALTQIAAVGGGVALGLSQADQARLQTAIGQRQNWSCDPSPTTGGRVANFILRAKRLNVYPDTVELVWFDDENPDDPMFALYAASVFGKQPASLCSRPRTIVNGVQDQYVTRPIVTVSR